jgi:uncharacterized protein (TIGR03437 family)
MRICMRWCSIISLVLAAESAAWAQAGLNTFFLDPQAASVGSAPATLRIWRDGIAPGMVVRWNGHDRPTRIVDSGGKLEIDLTAEDLKQPGIAELTVYNPLTSIQLPGQAYFPVGYDVAPTAVLFDSFRNRFYLTTPSDSQNPQFPPDSVVVVDPERNDVGHALAVGPAPSQMALSDDGKVLYLVVEGKGTVLRIDPERWSPGAEFQFRTNNRTLYNESTGIAVMPGHPETVALSYRPNPGFSNLELAIFDNGTKRAHAISYSNASSDTLLFSPEGRHLFAGSFCRSNCGPLVNRYTIDSGGFTSDKPGQALGAAPIAIRDGVLYTVGGTTIDIESLAIVGNLDAAGGMAVDADRKRILMLGTAPGYGLSTAEAVQAFDLTTLYPMGSQQTGSLDSTTDSPHRLFRWGVDGLAYAAHGRFFVFRTPLAGPAPLIPANGIVNAASSKTGPIAPGEILSIYGQNLGPVGGRSLLFDAVAHIPPALANVQVWFDQAPGTVVYASEGQINVVAPFGLKPGTKTLVQVWYYGIPSAQIPVDVIEAAPGIFTRDSSGRGSAAVVVYPDGSLNTAAKPGQIVTVFATGGAASGWSVDGETAWGADPLVLPVQAFVANREAEVQYAGACPGLVNGLFQVNLRIPANVPAGNQPLRLRIAGQDSPAGVTLEIR